MPNEQIFPVEIVTDTVPNEVPDDTVIDPETPASVAAVVRLEYEQSLERFRREFLELAEAEWLVHESNRKAKFIHDEVRQYGEPQFPYEGMSDERIFRLTRPYETRMEDLFRAGLMYAGIGVWLYRRGGLGKIEELRQVLAPFMPVDGDESILRRNRGFEEGNEVIAKGLSAEFKDLLKGFNQSFPDIGRLARHLEILRFVARSTVDHYGDERLILAPNEPDNYPPEEW